MKRAGISSFAKGALKTAALLGASTLAMTATARAEDLGDPPPEQVVVTGQPTKPQSPRYVAPLVDTPQTITIVNSETIAQQNLLNLHDV